MVILFNELSINQQFVSGQDFNNALKSLLSLKSKLSSNNFRFYCHRNVLNVKPVEDIILSVYILPNCNKDVKNSFFRWVANEGPFVEDDSPSFDSIIIEFNDDDISETGLGHLAYKISDGQEGVSFSFNLSPFHIDKLSVTVLENDSNTNIDISNFIESKKVIEFVKSNYSIDNWAEFIEYVKIKFENLEFLDCFEDPLTTFPFDKIIVNSALKQLGILNQLKEHQKNGNDIEYNKLLDDFFKKKNAIFRAESDTNKTTFSEELTFEGHFCHYHSIIPHNFTRMHFKYPVTKDEKTIVAYLGPKITKA